jgi:hypothetical protein
LLRVVYLVEEIWPLFFLRSFTSMDSQFTSSTTGDGFLRFKSQHPDATLILRAKDADAPPIASLQIFYEHRQDGVLLSSRAPPVNPLPGLPEQKDFSFFSGICREAEKPFYFHMENLTDDTIVIDIIPVGRVLPLNASNVLYARRGYTIPSDQKTKKACALKDRPSADGKSSSTTVEEAEDKKEDQKTANYFQVVVRAKKGSKTAEAMRKGSVWECAPGWVMPPPPVEEDGEFQCLDMSSTIQDRLGPPLSGRPSMYNFGYPPMPPRSYGYGTPASAYTRGVSTASSLPVPLGATFSSQPPSYGSSSASSAPASASSFIELQSGPPMTIVHRSRMQLQSAPAPPAAEYKSALQSASNIVARPCAGPAPMAVEQPSPRSSLSAPPRAPTFGLNELRAADVISVGPEVEVRTNQVDLELDPEATNRKTVICLCLSDALELPPYAQDEWDVAFKNMITQQQTKQFPVDKVWADYDECVVCQEDRAVDRLLAQCGHACVCQICAAKIGHACPVCRARVRAVFPLSAFA